VWRGNCTLSKKVSLPLQAPKNLTGEQARNWYRQRNFVICPLVLITTLNKESTPNAAVKTNFMTVSSMKSYAFCCSPEHHTYRNIMEIGEFVVNIPTEDIIAEVLKVAVLTEKIWPAGSNEIKQAGLTPIPSKKVRPPRIKECAAHYECLLDWHKDNLIVGKVIAISVEQNLMAGKTTKNMVIVGGGRPIDSYGIVTGTKKWPKISS